MRAIFSIFYGAVFSLSFFSASTAHCAQPLTLEDLISASNSRWVQTKEDFLSHLTKKYRESFSFVYHSQGQEQINITPQTPRIIFNGQPDLLMTVSGHSAAKPYIEVIHKNDRHEFVFYRIDFTPGLSRKDRFQRIQTQECFTCHLGRPIWDSYPVWPGMFGSMHPFKMPAEEKWLREFIASDQSRTGVYSKLVNLDQATIDILIRRNIDFSNQLAKLNAESIAHQVMQSPNYRSLRAPLVAAFHAEATELLPSPLRERYLATQIDRLEKAQKTFKTYLDSRKDREISLTGTIVDRKWPPHNSDPYGAMDIKECSSLGSSEVAFIFEQLGIDPRILNLSFDHEPHFTLTGEYASNYYFLPALLQQDRELRDAKIFPEFDQPWKTRSWAVDIRDKTRIWSLVQALDRSPLPEPLPLRRNSFFDFCRRILN